jgi:hypothetical protein
MEYALCDHCRSMMMEEFSVESKKRLAQFQDEQVTLDRGLDSCAVCNAGAMRPAWMICDHRRVRRRGAAAQRDDLRQMR